MGRGRRRGSEKGEEMEREEGGKEEKQVEIRDS